MIVSDLWRYPVKSLGGERLREARVDRWGIGGDRRWMVVDRSGEKLWAGEFRQLAAVSAVQAGGGVRLSAPGHPELLLDEPIGGERVEVGLRGVGYAVAAGDAADAWLSAVLGLDVRLVWLDEPARRPMSERHGGRPGDVLSFADAAPLLLTTMPSLRQLDAWIAENGGGGPVPMTRFRPNLVVDGEMAAFAEDGWSEVRVGEVRFRFAETCDRCAVTTLDPATGRTAKEPIRTLAKHRRWDGNVWFGVRVVPVGPGTISVGDPVQPI
ncbi:MOSC domain-containing protein [Actinoplanes oblitus]|uniref:MOSC domain-containing protein n=1 Tax=Actinoplanes oblitus TaxID=3040509 RepID=A0ABY8WQT0_9ACTN|nr:MOSC N-terminal beta barrel domain-containing protein [Actinoplanes oblitus]WIM99817.1 MOSC domain-containing protein [Actinoplanes oblitus]